jgi:hypothetical protein
MRNLIEFAEWVIVQERKQLQEKMLPSTTFTGSKKNKINGKGMLRNGPAKPGDLVGGG